MPALRAGASRDQPGAPIINQVQLCFRGRMRFVFRHFPMTEVHPHSEIAAESAEFAGSAGLFWDMHDALFENQSRLSTTTIFLIAQELGLCRMLLRRTNTQIECAAISWTAYEAASWRAAFFYQRARGMVVLTTMPPRCRDSRCALLPTPARHGRNKDSQRSRSDQSDEAKKSLRIDNDQCCFDA